MKKTNKKYFAQLDPSGMIVGKTSGVFKVADFSEISAKRVFKVADFSEISAEHLEPQ